MSLKIFEQELKNECQRLYSDLRDGSRQKRLLKNKGNSLMDIVSIGKNNNKIFRSCIITFGKVLEKATMNYAEQMKATKVYKKKRILAADIDIVFRIRKIVYNLESKSNIELDIGKTKKALETLQRKHRLVFNALDCKNEGWQVISKFVVWTKANSEDANKVAKKPLEEKHLMGFQDFFNLFEVSVDKDEFFNMIRTVWTEEVEKHF